MALFPSKMPKGSQSPWKLVAIVVLVLFTLAFILFKDERSAPVPPVQSQVLLVPTQNTIVVPKKLERLPDDITTALVHYASTEIIPQQIKDEIMMSARVLHQRGPCNFLVFGLGHDSLLWKTLNYGGRTVFLEESDEWVKQITLKHPDLEAYLVEYSTVLTHADKLLREAQASSKGKCTPVQNLLLSECRLAMNGLPNELYKVEWDVIMVDAPRGYFPEAPGRMSAIFSSSVMARSRKTGNGTDIFVHDIERPVEKAYSEAFLCKENFLEEAGHLWHFKLYPSASQSHEFCSSDGGGTIERKQQQQQQ